MTEGGSRKRIAEALAAATETRFVELGAGTLSAVGDLFRRCFGPQAAAAIVADENTFAAAGHQVAEGLRAAGVASVEPLVLDAQSVYADSDHVERVRSQLATHPAIPVAVGSGTINDLTKLASHRLDRPYLTVATAASMDGYTAYGASITHAGTKQTFLCPAPRAVLVDLDVLCAAPAALNAAGYADLAAKIPAGADWIAADALGIEPIHPQAWDLVQTEMRSWLSDPEGVRLGRRSSLERLMCGLLMTGFAMQAMRASRPAAGAEHQFSHLWDMQHHQFQGRSPLHGFKVAIGALASTLLYEQLLAEPLEQLDVAAVCQAWPSPEDVERLVERTHAQNDLRARAQSECKAKYLNRMELAQRLEHLRRIWPELREKLRAQLIPSAALREMFRQAGAPTAPDEIGIELPRMCRSCLEAQQIRSRYTVLDLANETGLLATCVNRLGAESGPWRDPAPRSRLV